MRPEDADQRAAPPWRRWLPLLLLAALLALVYLTGLHRELSLETLAERRETLAGFVGDHPFLAPLAFIAVYALATTLSVPGGIFLTLAGGFLFGTWAGGLYAVIGATLGAVGIFLVARTALGGSLRERAGPWLARLEGGFRADAFSYMLTLRLLPLFPFWLINLVPAFLGVSLKVYALATFLGIMPATFVYAGVGNGLGAVLDQGGQPDLRVIAKPEVMVPLIGLAALALLPAVYKRFRRQPGP